MTLIKQRKSSFLCHNCKFFFITIYISGHSKPNWRINERHDGIKEQTCFWERKLTGKFCCAKFLSLKKVTKSSWRQSTLALQIPHYYREPIITDTLLKGYFLLQTPRYYGHPAIADTPLLRTPRYYRHRTKITDTALKLQTPHYYEHPAVTDTPLLQTPHYQGHHTIKDRS